METQEERAVVPRKPMFNQVAICPGLLVSGAEEFEREMAERFGVRTQFLETIHTKPDQRDGFNVPGTGGRADVFFAVHDNDVMHFAIKRLGYGIRWIEDAISDVNGGNQLYPEYVQYYKTW